MFKSYPSFIASASFFLFCVFLTTQAVIAQNQKIFTTNYAEISYSDDSILGVFLWRISGKRLDLHGDLSLAESIIDRIIDRVECALDMYPDNFKVKIYLKPIYETGDIAFYSYKTNSIIIYADKITDGVFAHEIAHAVICNYFSEPPPRKIQEILAQYVDRHLWSDY